MDEYFAVIRPKQIAQLMIYDTKFSFLQKYSRNYHKPGEYMH